MMSFMRIGQQDVVEYWCDFCGQKSRPNNIQVKAGRTMATICESCIDMAKVAVQNKKNEKQQESNSPSAA